ncbi:hypothetical protein [Spirosoma endbachense]|uniref:Uncharacterized protein n=1 Tax=Spirosoma endbachense TaxID=2666025 RepID=A0A6P1VWV9_9BACT|nr:hypothetical protein [Spirosoma endbachense]QHV96858.1 hypothetical protein GJR95_18400 [Spirosoma endbachense]
MVTSTSNVRQYNYPSFYRRNSRWNCTIGRLLTLNNLIAYTEFLTDLSI